MLSEREILEKIAAGGLVVQKGKTDEFEQVSIALRRMHSDGLFNDFYEHLETSSGFRTIDLIRVNGLSERGKRRLKGS